MQLLYICLRFEGIEKKLILFNSNYEKFKD